MAFSNITGSNGSTIQTNTDGLRHGMVEVPVGDGVMSAYFAAPAAAERSPLILVVQEIFGLHEHIKDICRRLAHEGYMALGLELYQRQGDAGSYSDITELLQDIVSKVPDEQVMADLDAGVAWAAQNGGDVSRVGVTGFCWGGRITWLYAAHNPNCRAGVAWYGTLTTGHNPAQKAHPTDVAGQLNGPALGLHGGQDPSLPLGGVRRRQEARPERHAA